MLIWSFTLTPWIMFNQVDTQNEPLHRDTEEKLRQKKILWGFWSGVRRKMPQKSSPYRKNMFQHSTGRVCLHSWDPHFWHLSMQHSDIGLGWSSQVHPGQTFPGKGTDSLKCSPHSIHQAMHLSERLTCPRCRGSGWGHAPGLLPYIECEQRLLSGVSWQVTAV